MDQSAPSFHVATLAPAKLNLSLRIVGRRPDGYHLLDSAMVPISLCDRLDLTFVPGPHAEVRCRALQPDLPQDENNLAGRAARLFMRQTGVSGCVSITIDKSIPIGAGLGGGSSDAAAVLRMLDRGWADRVGPQQLARWSIDLGADVPFFVYGFPARVSGVGENVEPTDPALDLPIVVAFPGTPLSTAEVYRAYDDDSLTRSADLSSHNFFTGGQASFRGNLVNDLEAAAMRLYPPLRLLKRRMFELGACEALMTGSGSAVFGIWENGLAAQAAATLRTTDGIWARSVEILGQTPEVEIRDSRSMN